MVVRILLFLKKLEHIGLNKVHLPKAITLVKMKNV